MDTQLVRLESPYNIILGTDGKFGLHIATLIVTKEKIEGLPEGIRFGDTLAVGCYPVVREINGLDGDIWLSSELKNCLTLCREGEAVSLFDLKKVMKFCAKQQTKFYMDVIARNFDIAIAVYGLKVVLPRDMNGQKISEYEVCLEFNESNNGATCMVYSLNKSEFYFYDYFENEPPFSTFVHTNTDAIKHISQLRDIYLQIFSQSGLHGITFTTKDEKYQWFVDRLNDMRSDEKRV